MNAPIPTKYRQNRQKQLRDLSPATEKDSISQAIEQFYRRILPDHIVPNRRYGATLRREKHLPP